MAQDLARQNSQYTTKEILSRALKITTATSKRLRFNKVSAWQVAMREESGLVDKTLLQPVAGKGYQGRKGFDGKYSKHVSEEYKDTEKRLAWSKRATELNADAGVGTLESLHTTQKTGLKRLSNYLHELTNNEVHVILMACPTKAKPLFFTSAGFGAAYYKLIVASGRSHDEFMTACEGGGLLKQAVSATNSGYDGCLGRNKLRAEIVILLKELISKSSYASLHGSMLNYTDSKLPKEGFVNNIPRSRLDDFLKERKLKWKAPPDFGATQEEITKYLLLELLGPMKKIHEALKAKTLTLVKG